VILYGAMLQVAAFRDALDSIGYAPDSDHTAAQAVGGLGIAVLGVTGLRATLIELAPHVRQPRPTEEEPSHAEHR